MILCQVSFQISGPLWVHSLLHWQHHTGLVCRGPEVCSNGNSESNLGCILIIRLYFKYSTYHTIHIYPYLSISIHIIPNIPSVNPSAEPTSEIFRHTGTYFMQVFTVLIFTLLLLYFYFIYFYIFLFYIFLYIIYYISIISIYFYVLVVVTFKLPKSESSQLCFFGSLDHPQSTHKKHYANILQYTISAYLQYPPSRSCGGRPIFKALRRNAAAPSGCTCKPSETACCMVHLFPKNVKINM